MIDSYDSPRGTRVAGEEHLDRTDRKRDPGLQQGGSSTSKPMQTGADNAASTQQQQDSGSVQQVGKPFFKDWAAI